MPLRCDLYLRLLSFFRLDPSHLFLNEPLNLLIQLFIASYPKKPLIPHKKRRQKQRLYQVIEQGRLPAFILPVSNKLYNPANNMDAEADLDGLRTVLEVEFVGKGGGGEE